MTTFIPFEKYFKLELRTKELEKEIRKLKKIINKPVETTNERPKIKIERYDGLSSYLEACGTEEFKNANVMFVLGHGGYGTINITIRTADRHIRIKEEF